MVCHTGSQLEMQTEHSSNQNEMIIYLHGIWKGGGTLFFKESKAFLIDLR